MKIRAAWPALAAVVLLAGCSGGSDKPKALPTLSPTPAATATVAPVPSAAIAKTPQGADAFVRYFFEQMNVAFSTSNPDIIKNLQNGQCKTCDNYESALTSARSEGRFIQGQSFQVTDVAAEPLQALGTHVEVFGVVPARADVDSQGKVVDQLASDGQFHVLVTVKRGTSGWLVSDIAQAAK